MKREIKFRAWLVNEELMIYDQPAIGFDISSDGQLLRYMYNEYVSYEDSDGESCIQFILLLYTGLKDKNGKEIYESDKAKYKEKEWIVKWSDILAGFILISEDEKDGHRFGREMYMNEKVAEDVEITGNIYENPELI